MIELQLSRFSALGYNARMHELYIGLSYVTYAIMCKDRKRAGQNSKPACLKTSRFWPGCALSARSGRSCEISASAAFSVKGLTRSRRTRLRVYHSDAESEAGSLGPPAGCSDSAAKTTGSGIVLGQRSRAKLTVLGRLSVNTNVHTYDARQLQ